MSTPHSDKAASPRSHPLTNPPDAAQTVVGQRATHARYLVAALLFVMVVVNYLDRANLSIAMPGLIKEFDLSTAQQGLLLSAFGWTYAAMQIPGGWIVDHVKPRILYPICLILWSLSTGFMGIAGGFTTLIVCRLLMGVFEAPAYPINNRVVTGWFPDRERATAIGVYTAGQYIGLGILTPVLSWIMTDYGWQELFFVTCVLGVIVALLWYTLYRNPRESRRANQAELDEISAGGAVIDMGTDATDKKGFNWADLRDVVSSRKLWAVYIGQFCLTSTMWFFLTWFPTYLIEYRGIDIKSSGFLIALPYLAATVGIVSGGAVSDALLRHGHSLGFSRKTPIVIGLLLSMTIGLANFSNSTSSAIIWLTIAFFGNGFGSITWSLVSTLAPARLIGTTGGMFNFVGNLSSIVTPLVIGFLVSDTDFAPALLYIVGVSLVGILAYVFGIGKLERVTPASERA